MPHHADRRFCSPWRLERAAEDPAASGRDALRRRVKCRRRSVSLMSEIADRIEECGGRRCRDAPRPAGGWCGGDVTLPGTAGEVTAVDCEAGPAGRRRVVRR